MKKGLEQTAIYYQAHVTKTLRIPILKFCLQEYHNHGIILKK